MRGEGLADLLGHPVVSKDHTLRDGVMDLQGLWAQRGKHEQVMPNGRLSNAFIYYTTLLTCPTFMVDSPL